MKLAIRVEVDSLRPLMVGVPRLMSALEAQAAGATFLFCPGLDRSGRHLARVLRRGNPSRFWRTRQVRDYGVLTWLYGSVLPAPDMARRCADLMRSVRDNGFETGMRAYDPVDWQYHATAWTAEQTTQMMKLGRARYQDIFEEAPRVHGAVAWQMNRHAFRQTQRLEFAYSSDTRGTHPFIPVYQAEIISCPQLPATLPSMEELIGRDGITADNIVDHLLALTKEPAPWGHVFPASAAFEGLKLLSRFEELLRGWRSQGYDIVSLHDYMIAFDTRELPFHEVAAGNVPGRVGSVALQGKEFLSRTRGM